MLSVKPFKLLVKLPVPLPLFVVLLATVGLLEVLQQTPLAVTNAPLSEVTIPPLLAKVLVIDDTTAVITVGIAGGQGPQVGTPLQKVKFWLLDPGATVTQAEPFQ